MKKTTLASIAIISISSILAAYLYPGMPVLMASHWDANGAVNGYMPRFWGMFLMPIISLAMLLLLIWLPKLDPLKENLSKFRKYYDGFILLILSFLLYIYILTLAWNKGYSFDMGTMIMPAMAILFYYLGILIENSRRNWFIGIRTPWTLSSDRVWDDTHKIGGKLFKLMSLITLIGVFFGENIVWFVIVPVLFVSIYLIAYSYYSYKKK